MTDSMSQDVATLLETVDGWLPPSDVDGRLGWRDVAAAASDALAFGLAVCGSSLPVPGPVETDDGWGVRVTEDLGAAPLAPVADLCGCDMQMPPTLAQAVATAYVFMAQAVSALVEDVDVSRFRVISLEPGIVCVVDDVSGLGITPMAAMQRSAANHID